MHYWICVDDTDMPGTKGTGWMLERICNEMEEAAMGTCTPISRHQLFVHEDVPFTSHNSAMCFEMDLAPGCTVQDLIRYLAGAVSTRSQKGSDPGICITGPLAAPGRNRLIDFGRQAKKRICTKDEAYDLARELGLHLSEHGGTGDGVIGALAGTGLRMAGNDGRYRGWYHLGRPGEVLGAETLRSHPFIDGLVLASGTSLPPGTKVAVGSYETKTVRLGSRRVVVAVENENAAASGIAYRLITKQESKQY
ncbi:MAG: hypothetical protein HUN04_18850 [Desulfobacter sp.]|nr:MAG: hypothetical protein HUN04_18850 [Desulfobacter sp.]